MSLRLLVPVLAVALAVVVSERGAAQAAPDLAELNLVLTDQVAVPAYSHLAEEMSFLSETTTAFCQAPNEESLSASRGAFARAMAAWQQAQVFSFGPILHDSRAERIEFWPDKNGARQRQLAKAMAAQDPTLLAPDGLVGKSVALQSLITYEQLLDDYGSALVAREADEANDGEKAGRYGCGLATAIAAFQAKLAQQILSDWTEPGGYRAAMVTAVDGNSHYSSAGEAAAEYLRSMTFELEKVIKLKLKRPLGERLAKARPKRAESWRAGLSLQNIEANIETVAALYQTPGGFGDQLSAAGSGALDDGLRAGFAEAREILDEIELPLSQAVTDEEARAQLERLEDRLENLLLLLSTSLARDLDLPVGFNAMDGD